MSIVSLLDQFPLVTDAPQGIQTFRNLILRLAITGRLLPQQETDSPVAPDIARVRIQRPAPVESLLATFDLPSTWEWALVGELCTLRTGATPSTARPEYYGGSIRWLVSGDIHKRNIRDCDGRISEVGLAHSNCKLLPENSVLIALNGQGKTRATVAILRVPAACNQSLVAMTPVSSEVLLSEFLYLNLLYRYYEIRDITGQKQRRGLNMGLVGDLPISVAPIAEQHRIVAKVDELMALCDRLEAQQADAASAHATLVKTLLDTLTQSQSAADFAAHWQRLAQHFETLFSTEASIDALKQTLLQLAVMGKLVPQDPSDEPASELLKRIQAEKAKLVAEGRIKKYKPLPEIGEDEKPFELPEGWEWARFPELGFFGRGKSKHRPRNDPALFNPPIYPLVQTGEVARAGSIINEYHSKYSELGLSQSRLWPQGTLCITIAANIADSAILGFDACFPDSVVGFIPSPAIGDARYFLAFMKTAREQLLRFAPSTAQKNINLEILESVQIPLPPANEIHRIVTKIDELMALCDQIAARLKAARELAAHYATAATEAALEAA